MTATSSLFESGLYDRTPHAQPPAVRLLRASDIKSSLRHGALTVLFISVAAALSLALTGVASAGETAATQSAAEPAALVDALHSAFGQHHERAVHAKGILLQGSFLPTAQAHELSHAALFAGVSIPVTVRFSDFAGIPDIPDTADLANPRGFAVKFQLADGSQTDVVTHSFNGFPVATASEFGQLLRAIGSSGENAPHPTALDSFLSTHPIAKAFLTTQKPAPFSYATLPYFGVNSFRFTDAKGHQRFVRYRFVPVAGEHFLDAATLKAKGPDYLSQDIAARVAKTPVRFDWFAQISAPGDVIADPSIAWPESRKLVKLGTITITKMVADQAVASKSTVFMPGTLPAGIDAADPMIGARNASYSISFGERQ
jgi:catalase